MQLKSDAQIRQKKCGVIENGEKKRKRKEKKKVKKGKEECRERLT